MSNELEKSEFYPALDQANQLLKEALAFDEANDHQNALSKYTEVSQILIEILKKDSVEEKRKDTIRYEIYEVLNRAEKLKRLIHEQQVGSEVHVDLEIILKIEKISCYRIRACIGLRENLTQPEGETLYLLKSKENKIIVQIGPFAYQFNENIPCLRLGRGFYVFPGTEDVYYSIIFPRAIPDAFISIFECKLAPYCTFKSSHNEIPDEIIKTIEEEEKSGNENLKFDDIIDVNKTPNVNEPMQERSFSKDISNTIQNCGEFITKGIKVGSEWVSKGIQKGEDLISSGISTSTDVQVNDKVKKGFKMVKEASSTTVQISESIITGIAEVAKHVGEKIGQGISTVTSNFGGGEQEPRFITGVKQVGGVSISTTLSVWSELETAGITLMAQTGKGTSGLLEKKFGSEIGDISRDTFQTGLNVFKSVRNVRGLGVKRIARRIFLNSGKGALKEIIEHNDKKINKVMEKTDLNQNNNNQFKEPEKTNFNNGQIKENQETNFNKQTKQTENTKV